MSRSLGTPGALLVLLRREETSTRVLVGTPSPDDVPFAWSRSRDDRSQWALAEDLCATTWANEVSRLYASTLSVEQEGERLGVFVGFLDGDADDAPPPLGADWRDLRAAATALPDGWGGLLAQVRERFIARSPDEALRVR